MTAKYFAYGSNLDLLQMKKRCPLSKLISKGKLPGYRLTFNRYAEGWDGGVADVIQDEGSEVWGLVFEISDSDLVRLDHYEGYYKDKTSLYDRWKTVIDTPNGQIQDVWVYTVVEKEKFVQPTLEYLQIIKDAAVKWDFPKDYRQAVETATIKEETKIESALDRLRNLKEFSCIQCGQWIATLEDGLHDTCQTGWKIYTDCGLCLECWEKQIDPDAAREKFQTVMDKFWDIIKDDLNDTRSGGSS